MGSRPSKTQAVAGPQPRLPTPNENEKTPSTGGLLDGSARPEGPLAELYNRLSNAQSLLNWTSFRDTCGINSEILAMQLFRGLDKDKDGIISFSDFSRVMALFGDSNNASFNEQLKFVFTVLDVDDDRFVSKKDMTRVIHAALVTTYGLRITFDIIEEIVNDAFDTYDSDLDGKLTIENVRKMIIDQPQWTDVFLCNNL